MPIVKNDKELSKYKEFIEKSPYGNFMQSPAWSKVKKNWTKDFVYIEQNKQIIAAMSVIGIKNKNGKTFLYAPRGPVCDFRDYKIVDALIKEAYVLKDKYDAFLLRIDPEHEFEERPIYEYRKLGYNFRSIGEPIHSFTQPRYNMVLNFENKNEEQLFKGFSSTCRYNIRKSYRSNLKTVRETNQKTIDNFYELTKIMSKRQDINHIPKEYFESLVENMNAEIFSTYYEDKVLSSSILIPSKDKIYYLYAASSNEKRNFMPNYNMIWEEIKYSLSKGYKSFDFGGVFSLDSEDGLYKFKENFCHPHKYTSYIGELDVVYDKDKYEEFLKNK